MTNLHQNPIPLLRKKFGDIQDEPLKYSISKFYLINTLLILQLLN